MKQHEERLLKKVELASKIVLREDEQLFKNLAKEKQLECTKCNEVFDSNYECSQHCRKEKHYSFKLRGTSLILCFA